MSQCICGEASSSKLQPCSSVFKCILLAANSHLCFNQPSLAVHAPHLVASPQQAEASLFQHIEQDCFCSLCNKVLTEKNASSLQTFSFPSIVFSLQ